MKLYHSFPRWRHEDDLGLRILGGLFADGILLTPERLTIPQNPWSDQSSPPRTYIDQIRACFTLVSRSELLQDQGHTSLFGPFSIGLDSLETRQLGIVPTIYYYRERCGAEEAILDKLQDAGISQEILFRLAEVRRVLIALAIIEAKGSTDRERYKSLEYLEEAGLSLKDEPGPHSRLLKLSQKAAAELVMLFNTDRVPAWNLAEWVELILSMFQAADSKHNNKHLAYYSQREWRILQLYAPGITCIPLNRRHFDQLPPPFRATCKRVHESLAEIDERYELRFNPDDASILTCGGGRAFRDFIDEVIVPARCAEQVTSILQAHGKHFNAEAEGQFVVFTRI